MKKGSDTHIAYKHQQKKKIGNLGWYESFLEKEKRKTIKQYNKLAKYDFPIWTSFDKDLKYDIITSYTTSIKVLMDGENTDIVYNLGGGEIFPLQKKMGFVEYLHYIFTVTNSEDAHYRIVNTLDKHKVDYRDMKIDMFLG